MIGLLDKMIEFLDFDFLKVLGCLVVENFLIFYENYANVVLAHLVETLHLRCEVLDSNSGGDDQI
ncbi:hypothetical protein LXL04_035270 [Taraxacum kok-saghyz]